MHPMTALALAVHSLGHEVVFVGTPDMEPMIRACGLDFVPTGADVFPLGETERRSQKLSQLSGTEAVEYTLNWFADGARSSLNDGPRVLDEVRPDALVLDATLTGLNLVALKRGLPFVSVCNALHFDFSGRVPLCFFPFPYEDSPESRARNLEGLQAFGKMMAPLTAIRSEYIVENGLAIDPNNPDAARSQLAWITQCPREFDFPGDHYPAHFHYAGPFHTKSLRPSMQFPWEQLTGEPLIYASMGTLQNGSESLFKTIVAAAEAPGRQLVLSVGRNLSPEAIGPVAANTIVVQQAPQLLLLEKASLCITHAGLNTALEALSAGVPMVAIPITNDQPGVAARISASGTGKVVPLHELSVESLRETVNSVLHTEQYAIRARELQAAIQQTDGLNRAASLIDRVLRQAVA
jgi:MGT family glycosyltransferase